MKKWLSFLSRPWNRFVDSCLTESMREEPVVYYRSWLLITGACFLGSIALLMLLLYRLLMGKHADRLEWCIFVIICLYCAPLLVKWSKTYQIPGMILSTVLMFLMPLIGYLLDIYPAPFLVMLPIIPLVATFFVSATFGAISTLVQIIAIYLIYWKQAPAVLAEGSKLSSYAPIFPLFLSATYTIVFAFSVFFERSRLLATTLLYDTLDELQVANKAKDEFLARTSHELRTPLNAIIGYSEIIKEDAELEGQELIAEDAQTVLYSSQHLLRMIDDILDLSMIEQNQLTFHFKEVSLSPLLEQLQSIIQLTATRYKNELLCSFTYEQETLETDPERLCQLLLNLLDNAMKFTHEGKVWFRVFDEAKEITFEVEDTGKGIEQELQEHIFQLFQQEDMSTTRAYDGLGMGLYLVGQFTSRLGGVLHLESTLGKGTMIRLTLPRKQTPSSITAPTT